jgi:hypothetical protein
MQQSKPVAQSSKNRRLSAFPDSGRENVRQLSAIRFIKHEAVPGCGSFEVRFPDRPSEYFYWDDLPSRRLRPNLLDRETAQEQAKAAARAAETR